MKEKEQNKNKKILSIVTARHGSKVVPGKNYVMLDGKPLFMWSVCAALNSKHVGLNTISSNCSHVHKLSSCFHDKFDFEYIDRPDKYATDTSKNEDALIHAYKYCRDNLDFDADVIVNLQPTSPIRDQGLLDCCIERFLEEDADSLFTGFQHTPLFFKNINGEAKAEWDVQNRPMRQDIPDSEMLWHDCGSLYVMKTDLLLDTNCRLGGKMIVHPVTKYQSMQIDDPEDFVIIEKLVEENIVSLL